MTTMLEKAARANASAGTNMSDEEWEGCRGQWIARTRAALKAIRECDEATKMAGQKRHWGSGSWQESTDEEEAQNSGEIFTAMIDQILAQGEGK